jgi:hypothetical protein
MNWMIDDQNGNWLASLGQDEFTARRRAQDIADERGECVSLYCDGDDANWTIEPVRGAGSVIGSRV